MAEINRALLFEAWFDFIKIRKFGSNNKLYNIQGKTIVARSHSNKLNPFIKLRYRVHPEKPYV